MFDIESFKNCLDWGFDAFETEERAGTADLLIKNLKEKYECVGLGRHRIVFKLKGGNYVIKFPLGCSGEADNDWEGCLVSNKKKYHKDEEIVILPKTKWLNYHGFVCVIMEYLDEDKLKDVKKPKWANFVDDGQVGVNKDGLVLAFDYGVY